MHDMWERAWNRLQQSPDARDSTEEKTASSAKPPLADTIQQDPRAKGEETGGGPNPRVENLLRLQAEIHEELRHLTQNLCLLWADVVGSTAYYQKHGDVEGRLFIQQHNDLLSPLIEKHGGKVIKTVGDAIMASFSSPENALAAAIAIQRELQAHARSTLEEDHLHSKISLHYGKALVETNDIYGDLVNLSVQLNEQAEPDQILISQSVYEQVKHRPDLILLPLPPFYRKESGESIPVYEVVWQEGGEKLDFAIFRDFKGQYKACFYCGLQEHATSLCPSKHLEGNPRCLRALGYLPISEVLTLFQQEDLSAFSPLDSRNARVFEGFYEISFPYQLRFLRKVWLAKTEDWNEVERQPLSHSHRLVGTSVWRGLDCLRVGRYDQARTFFLAAMNRDPRDYKPHVALGFWEMENGNPSRALHHWRQALSLAQNLLQEVYISLLMYRLYEINGKTELARQELYKILAKDPYLYEANYQQVVLLAKEGKEEEVLAKLQKLIQEDWLVYLKVVLDPAFAPLRPILYPFLQQMFQEARTNAIRQLHQVTEELNRLHVWYPPPARIPTEINRSLESMRRHIKSNSFLGYQEAAYEGQSLQTRLHKLLFQRKEALQSEFLSTLSSLQEQLHNLPPSLYPQEKAERLASNLSRLRKFGDPAKPQQFWRAWRELQRVKMMVQQLLLPKPPVAGWKERLAKGTRLLLQWGLFSLLGGLAIDGLLLSIWGYRMYFSAFRPSEGELLTTLELGAIVGLLLGGMVRWIWGRYRVSH